MTTYLITGAAGFIGFHLARSIASSGARVVGVDNLNDYYSVELKQSRLEQLRPLESFEFECVDLADRQLTEKLFERFEFDVVVHLAAQAGVRHSLVDPHAYVDSNLVAFTNVLEGCRHSGVGHFVYASSSSVYGANETIPFSEEDRVDRPLSLYAATKRANELMAYSYSHLYDLPCSGLRFFTVYGPWGRPDMAIYKFTEAITKGQPIQLYNNGNMRRDFTYVDDVVRGVNRLIERRGMRATLTSNPANETSQPLFELYNIGNNNPVPLKRLVEVIEECVGRKAQIEYLPMQPGDAEETFANVDRLNQFADFTPSTSIEAGVRSFVDWYLTYNCQSERPA